MGKVSLAVGLGVGYVLGTRAGRERYEQLVQSGRQFAQRPEVQGVTGRARDMAQQVTHQPQVQRVAGRLTPHRASSDASAEGSAPVDVPPGTPYPAP